MPDPTPKARAPKRTVVYAINAPASAAHRAHLSTQIAESLESLRTHDMKVDVRVFAYGAAQSIEAMYLPRLADRHRVELVPMGSYEEGLASYASTYQASVLAEYSVLHKWLALAELPQPHGDQVLYVDNDTFFFRPVSELFDAHTAADFYAREEPFSSRSYAGYRPEYIDEAKLFALAEAEGARPLPTYNLGVVLLNNGMCSRLVAIVPELLSYVWRLCLGIVRDVDAASFVEEHQLTRLVRDAADTGAALPYPSTNYWIVEQLGLLLALGRVPDFTHDVLAKTHAIQGVEYHFARELPVLAHYYSSNTEAFFAWWQRACEHQHEGQLKS